MLKLLNRLATRWAHWVGDRDMEIAMRAALSDAGLRGSAAIFSRVRLVAIQRPGWLQIYSFDASWDTNPDDFNEPSSQDRNAARVAFGVVRQDERYRRVEIRIFPTASARHDLLSQWSDGLHRLRR